MDQTSASYALCSLERIERGLIPTLLLAQAPIYQHFIQEHVPLGGPEHQSHISYRQTR
jgi:hypothetical protein